MLIGYWCQVPLYMAERNVFGTDFLHYCADCWGKMGFIALEDWDWQSLSLWLTSDFFDMQLVYTNSSILLWNLTGQLHSLESHTKVICCFFCICRVIDKCGNSFMLGISWNKSDYLDPSTWSSSVACITIFHAVLSKICCLQCFDAVGWASGL